HSQPTASGIERCKLMDDQCLMRGVDYVLKNYATTGLKQLGLAPLDPLHIKKFDIGRNPNSPVNIDLSFREVDLLGLSGAVCKRVGGFTRDLSHPIEMVMEVPELAVKGPYTVDGRVLILPIVGKGKAKILLKQSKIRALIKFRPVSKGDGQTFAEVVDVKVDIVPSHVSFFLEGLFGGNKELGDNMHALINENWPEIFGELKPGIGEAFGLIIKSLLARIFNKFPLEQLFDL
ncbi:hypothetical protein KR009_012173, partial [Drosophila setifemur]